MSSCFVKGCRSGYRSIREENIRLGKRQKCLFKTPKCAELKKKWCNVLGIKEDQLKPNHVICEDHFSQKDVIKYDVIRLPDGTKILYEKGRRRLKPEAIPHARIKVDKIPNDSQANILYSEKEDKNQNVSEQRDSICVVKYKEIINKVNNTDEKRLQNIEEIQGPYSFQNLVMDINKKGGSGRWANTVNNDTIDFIYWDAFRFKIKMVLRVYTDLKMKLFTVDKRLIKSIDQVPESHKDVLRSLNVLEKTILCVGTGIKNKRAKQCLGEVDVSENEKKIKRVCKRCEPCRELRRKESGG